MAKIALFQPEIAGNVGSIIRTCACFDFELCVIEPCGFPFDMQRVKKSALDYIEFTKISRFCSFEEFYEKEIIEKNQRLILATTKGSLNYHQFQFQKNDIVIFGAESCGVPDFVAQKVEHKITIPMKNQMRCLNLAVSCAIIAAEFSTQI